MGLRVVDHLQPVLEAAQETIIVDQLRRGRGIDPAGSREPAERLAGRADAQLLQSPAPDQLLRLGEEFDLPNPPAAGLDVVPFHRDFSAAAVRVDLALDRVDVLDGCEVEVFPPDERLQLAQKASSGGAVAGDRTGLDQRCTFPILPDALIVGERCRNRHGERRRCRIRAKPKIGAERIAVAGVGFQNSHQLARQADKKGLYPVARTHPRRRRVIEDDQIDIARVIELVPAEFANAEHDEPAVLLRLVRSRERDEPLARRLAQQVAQRRAQRRLGKAAERRGLLLEGPDARQLGERGDKCDAPLGDAQAPHHRRRIFAKIFGFFDAGGDFGEERVGTFLDKTGQEGPFFDRDAAQKGAVAENRREQAFCRHLRRSTGGRDQRRGSLVPGRAPRSRLRTQGRACAHRPVSAARHHRGRGEITVSSGQPSRGGDTGGSGISGQGGAAERDDAGAGGEPAGSVKRLGRHSPAGGWVTGLTAFWRGSAHPRLR